MSTRLSYTKQWTPSPNGAKQPRATLSAQLNGPGGPYTLTVEGNDPDAVYAEMQRQQAGYAKLGLNGKQPAPKQPVKPVEKKPDEDAATWLGNLKERERNAPPETTDTKAAKLSKKEEPKGLEKVEVYARGKEAGLSVNETRSILFPIVEGVKMERSSSEARMGIEIYERLQALKPREGTKYSRWEAGEEGLPLGDDLHALYKGEKVADRHQLVLGKLDGPPSPIYVGWITQQKTIDWEDILLKTIDYMAVEYPLPEAAHEAA